MVGMRLTTWLIFVAAVVSVVTFFFGAGAAMGALMALFSAAAYGGSRLHVTRKPDGTPIPFTNTENTTLTVEPNQDERPPENLSPDLIEHLYWTLNHTPAEERRHSRWVMGGNWYADVVQLTDGTGHSIWNPALRQGLPHTILGLPIDIRDGEGPPHLEVYEGPKELPPARPEPAPSPPRRTEITKINMDAQVFDRLNLMLRAQDEKLMALMRQIRALDDMPEGYKENQTENLRKQEMRLREERAAVWRELVEWHDRQMATAVTSGIITINEARSADDIKKIRDMTVKEWVEHKKAGYAHKTMVLPEGAQYMAIGSPEESVTLQTTSEPLDPKNRYEKYVEGVGLIRCSTPEKLARAVEVVTTYPQERWLVRKGRGVDDSDGNHIR
jgi:hypothetical protein